MKISRVAAASLAIMMFVSSASPAFACGDKFLRPGRSSRQAKYAAAYPASILIVKSARSNPNGLKDWQKMLKKAGHNSLVVDGAGVSKALAGQAYDVLIADYSEAVAIAPTLQSISDRPGLLPVLSKSSKALEAQARSEFHSVIDPSAMTAFQALQEIDSLMEFRKKTAAVKAH
jgi:hypothetical protein